MRTFPTVLNLRISLFISESSFILEQVTCPRYFTSHTDFKGTPPRVTGRVHVLICLRGQNCMVTVFVELNRISLSLENRRHMSSNFGTDLADGANTAMSSTYIVLFIHSPTIWHPTLETLSSWLNASVQTLYNSGEIKPPCLITFVTVKTAEYALAHLTVYAWLLYQYDSMHTI